MPHKNHEVAIHSKALDYIRNHALNSADEVYGWLIGYENNSNIIIIAAISCHQYVHRSLVGAEPLPDEGNFIASSLPPGIGIVGIYHSHPDEVFHSHVDDRTVRDLMKLYRSVISIVTNGSVVEAFQMENDKPQVFQLKKFDKDDKFLEKNLKNFNLTLKGPIFLPRENPLSSFQRILRQILNDNLLTVLSGPMKGISAWKNLKHDLDLEFTISEFAQGQTELLKHELKLTLGTAVLLDSDTPIEAGKTKIQRGLLDDAITLAGFLDRCWAKEFPQIIQLDRFVIDWMGIPFRLYPWSEQNKEYKQFIVGMRERLFLLAQAGYVKEAQKNLTIFKAIIRVYGKEDTFTKDLQEMFNELEIR